MMKKRYLILLVSSALIAFNSCDDFLDTTPNDRISDSGIWNSPSSIKMYINDVYQSINGPLYVWSSRAGRDNIGGAPAIFDNFMTGDLWYNGGNLYNYSQWGKSTNLNALIRWEDCYTNIRKINNAITELNKSTVLDENVKERYLGDMYFWRGMLYYELFRFYGQVPIIDHAQNRHEEEIFNPRDKETDVVDFFVSDFEKAIEYLPVDIPDEELGRATKGAAIGMLSTAYLYLAGVMPDVIGNQAKEYYKKSYELADVFISGELNGKYGLFRENDTDKAEAYHSLFTAANEYNKEVIFDIQYIADGLDVGGTGRRGHDLMGVSHPGSYGQNTDGSYGGWGRNTPTQNLVDEFRMADGSDFDWNNPEHAANPYANREPRFYASILYNGVQWRGSTLYSSTNLFVYDAESDSYTLTANPIKRGTNSYTMTGYYLKKLIDPSKRGGTPNRYAPFEGSDQNLIVLRYAEILLTYAEARNEYSGPDASVYSALNRVRNRGGLENVSGLSQDELRELIRRERHIELCFENKRYFDIMRWRKGPEIIGKDVYGMDITYELVNGKPVPKYQKVLLVQKEGSFQDPKHYLMPVPDGVTGRNPNLLPNNPGW
ncbi:MAG: RagB/SusD family nutrient uptake outer membrane protein [Proteiniphilum sp.]|uniref:RagB/SusD family nutrient uptake outer membrane protein n=1 Tax=Proteiniphilum sp. TaxID=1926877 RepID=UPI002B1F9292|nr:RagB/SusD family nutrient uptake outer membrane protein [Proteiniphilum sp.]MEA5128062.1 RagB/SusD family nutrient uptake outer membrane protein [Proteiniphilum sp.]